MVVVLNQLSAHVHGRAVERAVELEGRFVLVPNRRAGVGAAHHAPGKTDRQRHGERDVALPDQLSINVKLTAAWSAFALGNIGFTGYLELEAQFVAPLRNGDVRFDVIKITATPYFFFVAFSTDIARASV